MSARPSARRSCSTPKARELGAARERTPWTPVPTGAELDPRAIASTALAVASRALERVPCRHRGSGRDRRHGGDRRAARSARRAGGSGDRVARRHAGPARRGRSGARSAAAGSPRRPACRPRRCARWASSGGSSPDPGAAAAVRWLGVPEWVARSLGAADVAELSLASRTGMLSLRDREWWPEALAWLGVPEGFWPSSSPRRRRWGVSATRCPGHATPSSPSPGTIMWPRRSGRGRPLKATSCTPREPPTCSCAASGSRSSPERIVDAVANGVTSAGMSSRSAGR